jgi:hypothetical protein
MGCGIESVSRLPHPADDAEGLDVVVVPARPGPLMRPSAKVGRPRDDLDDLIDELLPDTDERPGRLDAAFVGGGALLAGWGVVHGDATGVVVLGAVVFVLGSVLPGRALWRRARARRDRLRRDDLVSRGVALRTSDLATRRLVAAYEALVFETSLAESAFGIRTLAAGHAALLETGTLLDGRLPASDKERAYALTRAMAIETLTQTLRDERAIAAQHALEDVEKSERARAEEREAVVLARNELDDLTGVNSLTQLDDLAAEARSRRAPG